MKATDSNHSRTLANVLQAYGPTLRAELNNPETYDITLLESGELLSKRHTEGWVPVGRLTPREGEQIVRVVAGAAGEPLTRDHPHVDCELPGCGSRFSGDLPPTVTGPSFNIRKHSSQVFTLDDYVARGALHPTQHTALARAIGERRNLLVVGGTGSGKTTFLNALIAEMTRQCPDERLVAIEDTRELQITAPNRLTYRTVAARRPEERGVTMSDCLRWSLRRFPDRILVGEVRGPEAYDLLMCWSTGHPGGCASLHADSAVQAMDRVAMLVSGHPHAPRAIERLVASVVDVVIFLAQRRVEQLVAVTGFDGTDYVTESVV